MSAVIKDSAQHTDKPLVSLRNLNKYYGDFAAVDDISLDIKDGEFLTFLGSSGSGKSTTLSMLAGFETPSSGEILVEGQSLVNVPPHKRDIGMVFQRYSLFPHLSVRDNIAFPLAIRKLASAERERRVDAMLKLVQLEQFAHRRPSQLSGGQQQRVAIARALVYEPRILLMDEPLGALDKKLREKTQFELVNIQERLGMTFVVVTHDQEEAMTMSSRIGVMQNGQIEQVAPPVEIYEYPNTRFVANFIGSANLFDGVVIEDEPDHIIVHCPDLDNDLYINYGAAIPTGSAVTVMVRPEKMIAQREEPLDTYNRIKGIVREIGYLGDVSIYHIRLESGKMVQVAQANRRHAAELPLTWEDEVFLTWNPSNGVVLVQ